MRRILLSFFLLLTSRSFAQFHAYGSETGYPSNALHPNLPATRQSHFNNQSLVFEVRKSIPLSSSEKVTRDYYINSGTRKGIRKGSIVKVYRKTAVYDPFYNRLSQDLKIEVAELKIIHAEHNVSIGRIYSVGESADKVALDYQAPMVGDSLDVASARMPGSVDGFGFQNGSSSDAATLGDLKYLDPAFHQNSKQSAEENFGQIPDQTFFEQSQQSSVQSGLDNIPKIPQQPVTEALKSSNVSALRQNVSTSQSEVSPNAVAAQAKSETPSEVPAESAIKLEAGTQENSSIEEEVSVQVQ